MATSAKKARGPEKKIGPFAGGVGVSIWLNQIETDKGPLTVRSITINPPRYRDRDSGDWKDSKSFRPSDLPALLFALGKAQEFCYEIPLPNDSSGGNGGDSDREQEEIPY